MHSLETALTFGKYRGLSVAAIIRFNAKYLAWAIKNVPAFDLDAEARKVGQRAINAENAFSLNQQNAWAWGFGRNAKSAREKHTLRMIQIEREERRKAGLLDDVR
jgi:hypothetical protein